MIPRLILFALLGGALAAPGAGAAGPVYKCSEGGKTSYGDRPCPRGPSIALEPTIGIRPEGADAVPTRDARVLLEIEKLKIARDKERERERERAEEKRVRQERREAERASRTAAGTRKQCARLKLRHRWAAEDAARAQGAKRDAALLKARRQAQKLAVECPA